MGPKKALKTAHQAIVDGKSVLVVGSSGSGRNALLHRLVEREVAEGHLVASYGLTGGVGLRHTHAVIAGWIKSLGDTLEDLTSEYSADAAGRALVNSVLDSGPDLLSRRVVKASTLLPLGGPHHDRMILQAVRRATDRWAPFPSTRLRHQSRQVLESLLGRLIQKRKVGESEESILRDRKLILVVDHFDSVDSNSRALVYDLLKRPIACGGDRVHFILAAYA